MKPNTRNIFQPYLVDGAAITERLQALFTAYSINLVEQALTTDMGPRQVRWHVDNLCATYSFTEVLEIFECLTERHKGTA